MKAICDGDLVIGIGSGDLSGIDIPEALHGLLAGHLRFDGSELLDVRDRTSWHIDEHGQRHIAEAPGRVALTCAFDDDIEPDGAGSWRVVDQLARLKAIRKTAIDEEAERQRLRWITPGAGQAMEYQQAATEAAAYFAAGHSEPPPAGTYPMLEASIDIDGGSLEEVASVVLAMHTQWQAIGSEIRAARLAGKKDVDLATSLSELDAVTIVWPDPA